MPTSTRPTQLILLLMSMIGYYTIWYLSSQNTLSERMTSVFSQHPAYLENTRFPAREHYIGIRPIDNQLRTLFVFFHTKISWDRPAAAIQTMFFAGQTASAWTLLVVEGCRRGNKGRIISFVGLWGLAMQLATYGVIFPLYAILHLSTSPTTIPSPSNIAISSSDISTIIPAITVGYLVPSIALALPFGPEAKQIANAFWQPFPLLVSLAHQLFKRTIRPSISLRAVYIFALTLAVITHIPTVLMSLFPQAFFVPSTADQISFRSVFIPITVLPTTKVHSIAEGAHLLLQYDEIVGSTALVVWAMYLNGQAYARTGGLALWKLAGMGLVGGWSGAATWLIWDRDQRVLVGSLKEE